MELISYLNSHFFTTDQLLERCGIEREKLEKLQQQRMMPRPSYRIRLDIGCDSFFGPHVEQGAVDYYPKGCPAWYTQAAGLDGEAQAREIFLSRYRSRLAGLAASGIAPSDPGFANEAHLDREWQAFLDGIYGACTVSGLPEDIAAKEASVAVIRELTDGGNAGATDLAHLRQAVDMLDSVAAPFAPNEVARSSRRRYVDEMRAAWRL
jgi:hypothetical protein